MRMTLDIADDLLRDAMAASGLPTAQATIEHALRNLVSHHERIAGLAEMAGLGLHGDLDAMRQ